MYIHLQWNNKIQSNLFMKLFSSVSIKTAVEASVSFYIFSCHGGKIYKGAREKF